jgi:hypothetical protein
MSAPRRRAWKMPLMNGFDVRLGVWIYIEEPAVSVRTYSYSEKNIFHMIFVHGISQPYLSLYLKREAGRYSVVWQEALRIQMAGT